MKIGWIGLGKMGLGMARCAARAGYEVVGHSRARPEHQALVTDGGSLTLDYPDIAGNSDVVCINVFNDEQVRSVCYDDGVLAQLKRGTVLVVHTTSDPSLSRQLQTNAPRGVEVVDGAFSGSPAQAASGELTMMVGASKEAWARVQPLFATYAFFCRHVGSTGAGMQLKLLNNLLFAAQVRLAAETYRIAETSGFAAETVADLLARCSGASRALDIVGARGQVADNLERMRIYVDKDVATALSIANSAGVDLGILGAVASTAASQQH
jgi:3-hydroxyisobutyrate dehydrogenase-like beta-hydroxyacid dehydrogenase